MSWNPKTQFVNDNNYKTSDFVKGNHFLLMLPVLEDSGAFKIADEFSKATDLMPVGMIQNLSVNQSKQMQRIFEIGSNVSDFAEGGVNGNLSISKLQLNTGNMLKYFNFVKSGQDYNSNNTGLTDRKVIFSILNNVFANEVSLLIAMYKQGTNFDTDMSGDTSTGSDNIGGYDSASYPDRIIELKDVLLGSYSTSMSANNVMIAENLQFTFTRIQPVTFDKADA